MRQLAALTFSRYIVLKTTTTSIPQSHVAWGICSNLCTIVLICGYGERCYVGLNWRKVVMCELEYGTYKLSKGNVVCFGKSPQSLRFLVVG